MKAAEVSLHETNGRIGHLFRSESELQNEGKGGFLKGLIKLNGIDSGKEVVTMIEISLVSSHTSGLHCNLLRISRNSFEKDFSRRSYNGSNQQREKYMSPSAYKVVLRRDENNLLKLVRDNHGYLPDGLNDATFWNEETQTLTLGDKNPQGEPIPGLCITIVKPKSKQDQTERNVHIRQVLKQRKEDEMKSDLDKYEFEKRMKDFENTELNGIKDTLKRKKDANKNLETILADGEMHKAKLKVVFWVSLKDAKSSKNKDKEEKLRKVQQIEGHSKWILASNRYGFEIDLVRTNLTIFDNSSIQLITIFLETCKATAKMHIDAEFFSKQKHDGDGSSESISQNEIEIMKVNGSPVSRVDQKTLQLFIRANRGTNLNHVRNGIIINSEKVEFALYLRLMIRDESGVGGEDTVEVNCIEHICEYDNYLSRKDNMYQDIIKEETIRSWVANGSLCHSPCALCIHQGCILARRQYLKELDLQPKNKRRLSIFGGCDANDSKRSKTIGIIIHFIFS